MSTQAAIGRCSVVPIMLVLAGSGRSEARGLLRIRVSGTYWLYALARLYALFSSPITIPKKLAMVH